MTANELLRVATSIAFFGVLAATALEAVRRPSRERANVVVLFALIPATLALGWIRDLFGLAIPAALTAVLVMALPHFTLRAVADLALVPPAALRLSLAGLIASAAVVAAVPAPLPPLVTVALVLYFFAVEAYAAWVTVRASGRSTGVTRRRLQAVALGSLLLGLALLSVIVILVLPALGALTQLLAIVSAAAYYVGFATPGPLRHAWQASGIRGFLDVINASTGLPSTDEVLIAVARGLAAAVGAPRGVVGVSEARSEMFQLRTSDGEIYEAPADVTVGARAIKLGRAIAGVTRSGAAWALPYGVVLSAPVKNGTTVFGFVSVHGVRTSSFLEEDLALLQLLADQVAVVMQNRRLYDEVRIVNAEIEERARELEAVNRELGAFAYSVSHDLRAPLRSLDGFSAALLTKYSGSLDDSGERYLTYIRESSQEMGRLIDDLLRLSLVTRAEMRQEEVDLSGMAEQIVGALRRTEPERNAEVEIEPDLRSSGDAALVRAALENLLSNAWKFSGKRAVARIAFGRQGTEVPPVYYVRDNGAGFDMRYADKLFGAFQRLHAKGDFAGTGIGLATVQRVVHRHGGDVWAESAPDQGATFNFTLAPSPGRRSIAAPQEQREAVPA